MLYLGFLGLLVIFCASLYQSIIFYILHFHPPEKYNLTSQFNKSIINETSFYMTKQYYTNQMLTITKLNSGLQIISFNNTLSNSKVA